MKTPIMKRTAMSLAIATMLSSGAFGGQYTITAQNNQSPYIGNLSIDIYHNEFPERYFGIQDAGVVAGSGDNKLTILVFDEYGTDDVLAGIYASSGNSVTVQDFTTVDINVWTGSALRALGDITLTGTGYDLTMNVDGSYTIGIMALGGTVSISDFDNISITATGADTAGFYVVQNASVTVSANSLSIVNDGKRDHEEQWQVTEDFDAGIYQKNSYTSESSLVSITSPNITIDVESLNNADVAAAAGIMSVTSSTTTLTGDNSGKFDITVTGGSNYNFGIASEASAVTVSGYKTVEITSDNVGLITFTDTEDTAATSYTSSITLSSVEDVTINAKEGIMSFADKDGTSKISVTATNKIALNMTVSEGDMYEGTAVSSVFTLGGETVAGTSTVSLNAPTVEITGAKNAFAAIVDYETESETAGDASGAKSIINVTADTLNVTATDFVALAYADYTVIKDATESKAIAQVNINATGTATLSGNVFASHGSEVNLSLGANSTWTGFSQDGRNGVEITHTPSSGEALTDTTPGAINVSAGDGATWYVRPVTESEITENSSEDPYGYGTTTATISFGASNSSITSWNSSGKSKVDLRLFDASSGSGSYQTLNIGSLTGSKAIFLLNTDIDAERGSGQTDQVIIDSGDGSHYIAVSTSGEGSAEEQADYLVVVGDSGATFNLADENGNATTTVEEGLYKYKLASRDAEDGGTEWYLVRSDDEEGGGGSGGGGGGGGSGGGTTPTSNEGIVVTALAGAGARLSMHYAWLDDLRKRIGEVRYGAQDGLWARFIYQRDSAHGISTYGFRQNWYGLNFGLDHLLSQDESNKWLLGGNFRSGHASQKVKSVSSGKGNLNSYGLNLYTTYLNQYGCYADLVFSLDKYHQKLSAKTDSGSNVFGKFNTWGWGVSAEVGKMFSFKLNNDDGGVWDNHWWIEPQIQLSYYWTEGKNWAMNNGMTVDQKNGQSLVGRAGVVIGKQWKYGGSADKSDKRYAQVYVKGGVKHEFLGRQDATVNSVLFDNRLRGTSGYYGVGVDWNLAKKIKAYAQVERDAGGKYRKDIDVSVGLKWQF